MGECQFPPALIQACFILHTGCFSSQFLKVLFEDWQQNTLKLLCSIFWCWQCARWCSSALWSILASYSPCFGFPARNCHPYCKITFSADHVYDEIFNVAALSFSAWFSTLRCDNPVCGLVRFRNKKHLVMFQLTAEPHSQKILVADKMRDHNRDSWWPKRREEKKPYLGSNTFIRATSWSLLLMLFFISQSQSGCNNFSLILKKIWLVRNC